MAYSFLEHSGIKTTAEQTGHAAQKIFSGPETLFGGVGQLIGVVLGLLGIVFFILIFYGGWLWMTDQGKEEQVEKAKKIIINSSIGLAITLSAYAISYLIASTLVPASITQ